MNMIINSGTFILHGAISPQAKELELEVQGMHVLKTASKSIIVKMINVIENKTIADNKINITDTRYFI